jgi:hypothetical protein
MFALNSWPRISHRQGPRRVPDRGLPGDVIPTTPTARTTPSLSSKMTPKHQRRRLYGCTLLNIYREGGDETGRLLHRHLPGWKRARSMLRHPGRNRVNCERQPLVETIHDPAN